MQITSDRFFAKLPWRMWSKTHEKKNSIVVLDGIRAFATIAVIMFHIQMMAGDQLWDQGRHPVISAVVTFGGSGVTLFFVLSGFLLFLPYARSLLFQAPWPSMRTFYLKRILRILPGYYAALALIILFFQPQYLQAAHWKELVLFLTFFMDSTRETFRKLNGPFWTLAVEWQFYLLLPFIALSFLGVAKHFFSSPPLRRLQVMLTCCVGLMVCALMIRFAGIYFSAHPAHSIIQVMFFFLYGVQGKYIENFAVGMFICLCYTYAQHPEYGAVLKERIGKLCAWLCFLGLIALLFTATWHFKAMRPDLPLFPSLDPLMPYFDWLNEMVIAIGYGSLMTAILFGPPWLARLFSWGPLCSIGLISYGLYMWHLPLIYLFHSQILPTLPFNGAYTRYGAHWLWVVVVVVPVALASYLLIEKPWLRLRLSAQVTR